MSKSACADCGKTIYISTTQSAPHPRCRLCRSAATLAKNQVSCPVCGDLFMPTLGGDGKGGGRRSKTCSPRCGHVLRSGKEPSEKSSRHLYWAVKNAQRRQDILKDPVPYTLGEVAERDGFCCQLCDREVDVSLSGMERWGPTIDHVIPLIVSKDDRRVNVQLAHRFCNLSKRDGRGAYVTSGGTPG